MGDLSFRHGSTSTNWFVLMLTRSTRDMSTIARLANWQTCFGQIIYIALHYYHKYYDEPCLVIGSSLYGFLVLYLFSIWKYLVPRI